MLCRFIVEKFIICWAMGCILAVTECGALFNNAVKFYIKIPNDCCENSEKP